MVNIVDADGASGELGKVRSEAEERREMQRLADDILETKTRGNGNAGDEDDENASAQAFMEVDDEFTYHVDAGNQVEFEKAWAEMGIWEKLGKTSTFSDIELLCFLFEV